MTTPNNQGVAVTQGDREAAADLIQARDKSPAFASEVRAGLADRALTVQAFARHREEATRQAGWRGIESAPRDGTAFLAHDGDDRVSVVWFEPSIGLGLLCADGHVYPAEEWCWAVMDGSTLHRDTFTHWQPLPPPPTGDAA